ncbi:lipopolysaccharide biosynthesis protein [Flavobacterium sp. GSP27]|uniref:lipopolysaccharide biosynthesis protein n=1 Tax=Flavobacterium sp. GSP27 TaxID=2497489 RepID=UPI000F81869D|nr:lipopolysaccharide biosynthesis protein [Flavobacterium sp. GSP27]RTZ07239.1 lipopolysaccharide biosynthesis protein [Flavobacterium sp. GSP27]
MSSSKLIAKNTAFLYIRMLLTMGVTLFTSRIVLNALGIQDYGIYSIVGGIVTLFSFFNSAMTAATQRFLTFDIGKNDLEQLKKTFNATLNIHISIGVLFFLLAETFGLWFVNNKLNLPVNRMSAVNWVYQFSIFTFFVGTIQVPYDALIIAREKMKVYAYMSIVEVFLKLIIVYILVVFDIDKLIFYSFLLFLVSFISSNAHKIYCKVYFKETKYKFYYEKELYGELISFSGWSLFGNIAGVARGQGSNILLNIFFGTLLNAAYGISMQVQSAVHVFVTNFQMAVNPQIIKQYALGYKEQSLNLIFQSSKFSYFLMFIIACPIIYNIDFILQLWLKNPPRYTSEFVVLCLINILIDCVSGPLVTGAQATGVIKWYQITIGTFIFLCLPISYLFLSRYNDPTVIFIVIIVINSITLLGRLLFLRFLIDLNLHSFFQKVLLKIFIVTIILVLSSHFIFISISNPYFNFFVKSLFYTSINLTSIYFIGLSNNERNFIRSFFKSKLKKKTY